MSQRVTLIKGKSVFDNDIVGFRRRKLYLNDGLGIDAEIAVLVNQVRPAFNNNGNTPFGEFGGDVLPPGSKWI